MKKLAWIISCFACYGCTMNDPLYCDANQPCGGGLRCDLIQHACVPRSEMGADLGAPPRAPDSAITATMVIGQGSKRCLTIVGPSADWAAIQLWDCNGAGNQRWLYNDGDGTFTNPQSSKCLAVKDGVIMNKTPVQLGSCNGSSAQQWHRNFNGTVVMRVNTSMCLDAVEQGTANGTGIQIYDCYGGGTQDNQVWQLAY